MMKTLLCAIGKNENQYIEEWVSHYKNLGFTNICLFDNNDLEGEHFEDVIGEYINSGFVKLIDYRGRTICQLDSYTYCYNTFGNEYDWVAFFDCDEFLTLVKNKTIDEYLNRIIFKKAGMIHINWMNYTDCDLVLNDKRPLLERFTVPADYDYKCEYQIPENYHTKTIMRGGLGNIKWVGNPHNPGISGIYCVDGSGRQTESESPFAAYTFSDAYLKHFTTKSAEEYANKLVRGFPDQSFEKHKSRWKMLIETRFFKTNRPTKDKIDYFKNRLGIDVSDIIKVKNNERDIQIFSLCYTKKNFEFINDSVVTPLQVGAALNHEDVCDLKDNTGNNISTSNFFFIENTGTYWIWKNVKDCKYKGQMQYRRPLSGVSENMDFDTIFRDYDVITCKPFHHPSNNKPTKENNYTFIPANTVEEGYAYSNCAEDLKLVEEIINESFPEYRDNYKKYIKNGEYLYYSSGFILKSEDFDRYAKFYFDIMAKWLEKTHIKTPLDLWFHVGRNVGAGKYIRYNQGPYEIIPQQMKWQTEIGGFLGERIWTLWLLSNFSTDKIYQLEYIKQEDGMYT